MRALAPVFIAAIVILGAMRIVPAEMEKHRSANVATPGGYAEEYLDIRFDVHLATTRDPNATDGEMGQLMLAGGVRNRGDRPVQAVILEVRYRTSVQPSWETGRYHYGPVPPGRRVKWTDALGVAWGRDAGDSRAYDIDYEIKVIDVVFE